MKSRLILYTILMLPYVLQGNVYLFNDNPDQLVSISPVGSVAQTTLGSSVSSSGGATLQPICQVVGVLLPVTSTPGHYTQVGNSFLLQIPSQEVSQTPGFAQTAKVYSTQSTVSTFYVCSDDPPRPLQISEITSNISQATDGICYQQGIPTIDSISGTNPCS
ncbi:MAG: hypothetical protein WD068_03580 [Candidatus Babeliales bacterium]